MKAVYKIHTGEIGNYEFTATKGGTACDFFLASNSLNNLKKEIKVYRWRTAFIQCEHGKFSHGQTVVDTYCYAPRYQLKTN